MKHVHPKHLAALLLGTSLLTGCSGASDEEREQLVPQSMTAASLPDLFVAVGEGGAILTSPDGTTWTRRLSGTTADLRAVASDGRVLVAVGRGGTLLSSTDGTNWVLQHSPTSSDFSDVTWADGSFVAVGGDFTAGAVSASSVDGLHWQAMPSPSSHVFETITWSASGAIASAVHASDRPDPALFLLEGPNGWSRIMGPPFRAGAWTRSVTYAVEGRSLHHSVDGATWLSTSIGVPVQLRGVAGNAAQLVTVGERGTRFGSPDGSQWTPGSPLLPVEEHLMDVAEGAGRFVAVGRRGLVATSLDGLSWTDGRIDLSLHLAGATFTRP